jgi:O-antigen ligase
MAIALVYLLSTGRVTNVLKPMLIFFLFIFISLLFSVIDADAISQTVNFIVVFLLTIFLFSVLNRFKNELFSYIGTLGGVLAYLGIVEALIYKSVRVEATFANSNYYALFIAVSFVLVYAFHTNKYRIIYLPAIVLAIIFSGSRAALLVPIVTLVWEFFSLRLNIKTILSFSMLCIVLAWYILSGSSRFQFSELSGSDAERILFAKVAIEMIHDHPLTGVGWGRFIGEFGNYSTYIPSLEADGGKVDIKNQQRRVTHNDLLRIASELGIPAFIVVVFFIVWNIKYLLSVRHSKTNFLFPIWLGFLIFSLTHNNLNTAYTWFFILLPYYFYSKQRIEDSCYIQVLWSGRR